MCVGWPRGVDPGGGGGGGGGGGEGGRGAVPLPMKILGGGGQTYRFDNLKIL